MGDKRINGLIRFLKDKTSDKILPENIINVFKPMCSAALEKNMILFET